MGTCPACCIEITDNMLVAHLEEVHVGSVPLDEILLLCHSCPFEVVRTKLEFMVNHCQRTGHPINQVKLDWRNFARLENQRVADMLRFGSKIVKSNTVVEVEEETDDEIIEIEPQMRRDLVMTPKISPQISRRPLTQLRPKPMLNNNNKPSRVPKAVRSIQKSSPEQVVKKRKKTAQYSETPPQPPKTMIRKFPAISRRIIEELTDSPERKSNKEDVEMTSEEIIR